MDLSPNSGTWHYLPDILAVAGVAWLAWKGWQKGLFIELFSLACLALALFIGLTNYDLLLRFISPYFESASIIALVLSVLLTIFLIYKLFTVLGKKMKKMLHETPFGLFDNVAGSLFAFAKITLALYSMYWSLSRFAQPQSDKFLADHTVCSTLIGIGRTEFNLVRSGVKSLISGAKMPSLEDLTSKVTVMDSGEVENR